MNETEKYQQKVEVLSNDIENLKNATENYQKENEKLKLVIDGFKNDAGFCQKESDNADDSSSNVNLKNDVEKCQQELEESNNGVKLCQQKAVELESDLEKCQREAANECSSDQSGYGSLQPTGNVVISLIRQVENAREIDACIGMSTDLGYVTSNQCCHADQLTLFDLETFEEIPIGSNSIWIEEHACLINTTEIQAMNFPTFDIEDAQSCSTLSFDESEGQFTENQLDIEIGKCFDAPCFLKVDSDLFRNGTILNGTSVVCDEANQIGIITKSEFYFSLIL